MISIRGVFGMVAHKAGYNCGLNFPDRSWLQSVQGNNEAWHHGLTPAVILPQAMKQPAIIAL